MPDGKSEAYFRGRKLIGQEIKVPEGYRGVMVKDAGKESKAAQDAGKQEARADDDPVEEEEEELDVLQEIGSFDEIILWGHESIAESDDAFVKGMGEWIRFAEAVSLYDVNQAETKFSGS